MAYWHSVISVLVVLGQLLAIFTLAHILISSRSASAAWGWGMAVVALPYLAIPLYAVFGRKQLKGYLERRREVKQTEHKLFAAYTAEFEPHFARLTERQSHFGEAIDRLSERRFTRGNVISLNCDGEFFREIHEAIENAQNYILAEFFIIKADETGVAFSEALCAKAQAGVRVYLLFDEIGSYSLSNRYLDQLRQAGVEVKVFRSGQGRSNRFQINFRNHRKIFIADGTVAFCGGHNIANEYTGISPRFGTWRDTSVKIVGPAAMSLQMVFLEDWYWVARSIPQLNWIQPVRREDDCQTVMILPFGPVEQLEAGLLFFLDVITRAEQRLWIATPYFVPDAAILSALQLAALRGVDVRVMMPAVPDKWLPWLASFSFLQEMQDAGVKLYRYAGFLHQKVLLVDNDLASVGTANFDNRSMRLNFEVNVIVLNEAFCREVETMLVRDFEECKPTDASDYRDRPWWFRLAVKLARLAGPLL